MRTYVGGREVPALTGGERPATRGDCEPCPTCQADRDVLQQRVGRAIGWRDALTAYHDDLAEHAGPCPSPRACGHDDDEMLMRSRPCLFVGCVANNYLDLTPDGNVKLDAAREPWQVEPWLSCALDVADDGEHTLEEVGGNMGIVRERARQLFDEAAAQLRPLMLNLGIDPGTIGGDFNGAATCNATMG